MPPRRRVGAREFRSLARTPRAPIINSPRIYRRFKRRAHNMASLEDIERIRASRAARFAGDPYSSPHAGDLFASPQATPSVAVDRGSPSSASSFRSVVSPERIIRGGSAVARALDLADRIEQVSHPRVYTYPTLGTTAVHTLDDMEAVQAIPMGSLGRVGTGIQIADTLRRGYQAYDRGDLENFAYTEGLSALGGAVGGSMGTAVGGPAGSVAGSVIGSEIGRQVASMTPTVPNGIRTTVAAIGSLFRRAGGRTAAAVQPYRPPPYRYSRGDRAKMHRYYRPKVYSTPVAGVFWKGRAY